MTLNILVLIPIEENHKKLLEQKAPKEPLPKDHRLWKIENAVITLHVSGGNSLKDIMDNIMDISIYNLEAFLNGGSLSMLLRDIKT